MDGKKATDYLQEFERRVVIDGFRRELIGKTGEEVVPLRAGRLAKEALGQFVGKSFHCDSVLAINYYGLYKLSSGIYAAVESVRMLFPDLRSIKSPVVHFNSLKAENVIALAPDLAPDYERFKKYIVQLRWHSPQEDRVATQGCSGRK